MSGDVKFKINGKTYTTATVDQISLRDVMLFNPQAAEIGLGVTWGDVERIAAEMSELTEDDAPHPQALLMFGVTVWAARRLGGDDVTLGEAIDVPMSSIEIVEAGPKAPKDRLPKKGKKTSSRKATAPRSLAVADEAGEGSDETTPSTSSTLSESA